MHPILHKIKAHNGVDYAARRNTPIKASGEGVISFAGWKSGYGRDFRNPSWWKHINSLCSLREV